LPPQYIGDKAHIERSIIGEGSEIYGKVYNSVIGTGVVIEEDAVVHDSIIMKNCVIGKNSALYKAIIAEDVVIGDNVEIGIGEDTPNVEFPKVYNSGIATIGENSIIPNGVKIGKNTAIFGITEEDDYADGFLVSGGNIIKAGED